MFRDSAYFRLSYVYGSDLKQKVASDPIFVLAEADFCIHYAISLRVR